MNLLIIKAVFVMFCCGFLFTSNIQAQFEQKFTFQASGGYVQAIEPEMFSQTFHNGFSLDAGAQYNFSRSTSLVMLAKYSTFLTHDDFIFQDASYNLVGLSLCPKYRFMPYRSTNPYFYGGVSLNYETTLMYPNPWEDQIIIAAGEDVSFPFGYVDYYLEMSGGDPEVNRLLFVFTKNPVQYLDYLGQEQITTAEKVFSWVYSLTPDIRRVDYQTFSIR